MSSNTNLKISSEILEKHLLNLNNKDNYHRITTINNNEIYDKLRPLKRIPNIFKEHQAHGDDTRIQISNEQEKSVELFSYESQQKSDIPLMSSSSNEFSFEVAMPITDTSNEALKTDDENGMTKPYFISNYNQKDKEIILSDVSLRQLPMDECEYEIDLGNGYITKSISSYHKQQRTTSIVSADSIQPITTVKIPFTNAVYKQEINDGNEPNVLFNSKFSFRTVTIFSIGTTIMIFLIVVMFFVF